MRRAFVGLGVALLAIGVFTGGLAWLLETPKAPPGASRAEQLYYGLCVSCHGVDGRGSRRAALFLIRPGDLANAKESDQYLFDLIKNGGSAIGRPGMPGFGSALTDDDVRLLVEYVRSLPSKRRR
jgi:mono/diheme cytochrome c family protein